MAADHPELAAEQAYVLRAWDLLDRGLADAERSFSDHGAGGSRATQQAMHRALQRLRESRGGDAQLVAGRFDVDGEAMYIGRRGVHDDRHDRVVVNWHAPAARAFFEATPDQPSAVTLKRIFREEERLVRQVFDEIVGSAFAAADDGPTPVSDALLAELERSRDGAMRDVVATIQAEQYRIMRAPGPGVLVVEGGPGTGKTVVGLHRAVFLAFNDEALRRAGILVVAPTLALLSYVSGVLPSLDARDLQQADLASLYAGEAAISGVDDVETARVKGSEQMAQLLRRALEARVGWTEGDLQISLGGDRFAVPGSEIEALLNDIRHRPITYTDGRDVLRAALSALAFRHYSDHQQEQNRPRVASEAVIRRLTTFTNALDRMWPAISAEEMLRSLYGTQTWLADAADGVLTADERARLFRTPSAGIADEPWTLDDLFCLDELAAMIYGPSATFGHIVIDEAQDLSPMQARAVSRRCPTSSFTVLGDLAQATGAWVRDTWGELTQHLSHEPAVVETLSIGYRVPAAVLALAARQLPLISPALTAPSSIRLGRGEPLVRPVDGNLLDAIVSMARDNIGSGLRTGVIVADASYEDMLGALAAIDLGGDGRSGDFSQIVTVVPASDAKGLEFDAAIVVEPGAIVSSSAQGRRLLYIAMTRPTQQLGILHCDPLPAGLDHLNVRTEAPVAEPVHTQAPVAEPAPDPGEPLASEDVAELVRLFTRLSSEDRELLAALARRLGDTTEKQDGHDHG
jgi:DNA helicase IV